MVVISTIIKINLIIFLLLSPENITLKHRVKKSYLNNKLRWQTIRLKLTKLLLLLGISFSIGSIGIYSFVLQTNSLSFIQNCESLKCWGKYPKHLSLFSPFLLIPLIAFIPVSLIAWKTKKRNFGNTLF